MIVRTMVACGQCAYRTCALCGLVIFATLNLKDCGSILLCDRTPGNDEIVRFNRPFVSFQSVFSVVKEFLRVIFD